jgi:hypothetical protein
MLITSTRTVTKSTRSCEENFTGQSNWRKINNVDVCGAQNFGLDVHDNPSEKFRNNI